MDTGKKEKIVYWQSIFFLMLTCSYAYNSNAQCGGNIQTRTASVFQSVTVGLPASWSNPSYAQFNDANVSVLNTSYSPSCTLYPCQLPNLSLPLLQATDFGFSIPSGATICGVQVTVLSGPSPYLFVTGGTIPASSLGSYATLVNTTTSLFRGPITQNGTPGSPFTFGGSNNLWSFFPLLDTDVNDPNFGVRYVPRITFNSAGSYVITGRVGYIEMTITYDTSLPVNILSFTAENKNGENIISWTSSSEINNARYHLERSTDGKSWQPFRIVEVGEEKMSIAEYSVTDHQIDSEIIYYKLSQEDRDGTITNIGMRSADADLGSLKLVKNINVNGVIELLTETDHNDKQLYYSIISSKGRIEMEGGVEIRNGKCTLNFQGEETGLYYLTVHNGSLRKVFKFMN